MKRLGGFLGLEDFRKVDTACLGLSIPGKESTGLFSWRGEENDEREMEGGVVLTGSPSFV